MHRNVSRLSRRSPRRGLFAGFHTWLLCWGLISTIGLTVYAGSPSAPVATPPREDIEWLDVWMPHSNAKELPRVLLIGDSITRAYYPEVEKALEGKAYVARLATSKSLGDPALVAEVSLVLGEAHFDLIHFNNGLHGAGYSEAEYQRSYPILLARIRQLAPGAKLVLATTTPVRESPKMETFAPFTDRVKQRNQIVKELALKSGIPIDDLFGLVESHPEYYVGGDGVHLVSIGVSAQAQQVAGEISKRLSE